MEANIGLSASIRQQIAQNLSLLLADTYVLYAKTKNFQWNIIDSRFYSIRLFMKQESDKLQEANEEIAERIHILGERSPYSLKQFLDMTSLKESNSDLTAEDMLLDLIKDHETICCFLRDRTVLASKLGDEGTAALLIQRLCAHEKSAWMLRSQLHPISV